MLTSAISCLFNAKSDKKPIQQTLLATSLAWLIAFKSIILFFKKTANMMSTSKCVFFQWLILKFYADCNNTVAAAFVALQSCLNLCAFPQTGAH